MTEQYIRICIFLVIAGLSLSISKPNIKKGRMYLRSTKYMNSSIFLKNDGSFEQAQRGCTYAFSAKGHWSQKGDTIYLNQEKLKIKFGGQMYADQAKKLLKY